VCVWIKIIIIASYLKAYGKIEPTLESSYCVRKRCAVLNLRRVISFSNVVHLYSSV